MDRLIECAELGFVRDIPAELLKLEKQNADLLKINHLLKKVLIVTTVGIGILIITELLKTKKDAKRNKLRH